jgi:hypothetical protein
MKLIPIHDDTAPIACTISEADIPGRLELLERLRASLRSLDRTELGMLLYFPSDETVRADVRQFAVDEKRCCQFWGFAVTEGEDLVLRWDGPTDVSGPLDQIAAWFRSDEPGAALRGLL